MSNLKVFELNDFNNVCDEFVNGKYILADIKIGSILKMLEAQQKVKDIIADALQDFSYEADFEQMFLESGAFNPSSDDRLVIGCVYSLLYKIYNHDIDLFDFINTRFGQFEDTNSQFVAFSKNVVLPFKNALNSLYSKRYIIVDADDYQQNYYNKIMTTIKLVFEQVDDFRLKITEKEEFTMLLNSLYVASNKSDKKLVFSLMIALDYFTRINKKARVAYLQLEECFNKD